MGYCTKGSLDYVGLNIGEFADYTEWAYQTACGVSVSLAHSVEKSLIILEIENAFVTCNSMDLDGGNSFSTSDLEAFADSIDFSLLK